MSLTFSAVGGLPEIESGDDIVERLAAALRLDPSLAPRNGDVLVFSQKIVSKAEGRYVKLASVKPSARARSLAARCRKDPRLVELVLSESTEVLRAARNVLIVRHRLGFVVANAGIDQSNLPLGSEHALLLPADPDASAARLRSALEARYRVDLAVLISDSFGRAWRLGVCGVCIGCSGLQPLIDLRGARDRSDRPLEVTQIAVADQLCATATLVCGEAAESRPVVIVRGIPDAYRAVSGCARDLVRPLDQDLFR